MPTPKPTSKQKGLSKLTTTLYFIRLSAFHNSYIDIELDNHRTNSIDDCLTLLKGLDNYAYYTTFNKFRTVIGQLTYESEPFNFSQQHYI